MKIHSIALALTAGLALASLQAAPELEVLPKKRVPMAPATEHEPVATAMLEGSIKRGVDYLVESQNPDGSWGGVRRTKGINIYSPMPGGHHAFRMGSSALAIAGLIASEDNRPEVIDALEKSEAYLLRELPKLRRADATTTYNNWGHAYGLRALCALAKREGISAQKKEVYAKLAAQQVKVLFGYQDIDGGWGYLHFGSVTAQPSGESTSFTSATVMLALFEAQQTFDLEISERLMGKAMLSVQMQRTPDFAYAYAMGHRVRPRYPINRPAGSLARTPVCNAALRVWGDEKISDDVLRMGLDRLVKRNGWLDIGRKRPVPHETHFAISGYFYYYGHYYATECVELLPEVERLEWRHKLAHILLDKQERDGSWWDYPLYDYHQAYGTGYTLVALSRCRVKPALH